MAGWDWGGFSVLLSLLGFSFSLCIRGGDEVAGAGEGRQLHGEDPRFVFKGRSCAAWLIGYVDREI
jgi:hypothetical protein